MPNNNSIEIVVVVVVVVESVMLSWVCCTQDEHVSIAQSGTIARYLARKHGLFGTNEFEAVHIDELYEGTQDLYTKLRSIKRADESKKVRWAMLLGVA